MIEQVLIQVDDEGSFQNAGLCAAFLGFHARGRDVSKASARQIEATPADPECLVFGGVATVRSYLARLGCEPPDLDYPESLRPFMGRSVEVTSLGEIRRRYNESGPPVFVKPVRQKTFHGQEVSRFRDLIPTSHLDATTPVYCVELVEFVSEWRVYCRDDQAVGIGHYRGDPLLFPDKDEIREALLSFKMEEGRPQACALDFGIVRGGETLLVEANDMFALGSYGLDPQLYSELIEHRWTQLVSRRGGAA